MRHALLAALMFSLSVASAQAAPTLVERLGFQRDARVAIVNIDDVGMNHATNQAAFRAFANGTASSFTVLVPCPWFPEVVEWARANPGAHIGVHLALNSEWRFLKWGPVAGRSAVPSLVDAWGYFPPDLKTVRERANLDDIRIELEAQIDRALQAGLDVDHLDSHMLTLMITDPRFYEVLIQVATRHQLPVRVDWGSLRRRQSHHYLLPLIEKAGIVAPDQIIVVNAPDLEQVERAWTQSFERLPPGQVSEYLVHVGQATAEMEATAPDWLQRAADGDALASPRVKAALERAMKTHGVRLISYKELRDLQRRSR